MTIVAADIQFHTADRNDDTDMGGGLMTSTVIENGAVGQLFGVVSDLDRAGGNVSLRKVFAGVFNNYTDTYYGTYALISKQPEDTTISATLCQDAEWADRRTDATDRLESYLIAGAMTNYVLYGLQLVGTRSIRFFGRVSVGNPVIGKTYVLSENEDQEDAFSQFFRIKSYTAGVEEFFDGEKFFSLKVITAEITSPLLYSFHGGDPSRELVQGECVIRNTTIADAAKYYGITTLADAAEIGDSTINVDSIYTQLIPSSLIENQLTGESLATTEVIIPAGEAVTFTLATTFGGQNSFYLGRPCAVSSVTITCSGNTWISQGNAIYRSDIACGTINNATGEITFDDGISVTSTGTIEYTPACPIDLMLLTYKADVIEQNHGRIWSHTFGQEVMPTSGQFEYCALGDWYRLIDNGEGVLIGETEGIGIGTIDYSNGYMQVTTEALPDIDSPVIFKCGWNNTFLPKADVNAELEITYPNFTLIYIPTASSITVNYYENSAAKIATDDGNGLLKISNVTVGSVDYNNRLITINRAIDANSEITVNYTNDSNPYEDTFININILGVISGSATLITAGSVLFTFNSQTYFDDNGNLYKGFNHLTNDKTLAGTIDYVNRTITITNYTSGAITANLQAVLFGAITDQIVSSGITRLSGSPIKVTSVQVTAETTENETISAQSNIDGEFEDSRGEPPQGYTYITGTVSHAHGVVDINFGSAVKASSIAINAVYYSNIPINEEILGLSPTKLPIDGRVPMVRDGEFVLLHDEQTTELTDITENTPFELRPRIESCYVIDANEDEIDELLYTVDKINGTVTILNLTGLTTPLSAVHRITDLVLVSNARINGSLKLSRGITHDYPSGAYVSSCLPLGNKQGVIYKVWAETTWINDWEEILHGSDPIFSFDYVHYPITTTNRGAEDDQLAIIFTNTTAFNVISKNRGQIASGTTASDLTITNPAGGTLAFIPHLGWGAGWTTGAVLRIVIHSVHSPLWIARTVMPSDISTEGHTICCELRGNVAVE